MCLLVMLSLLKEFGSLFSNFHSFAFLSDSMYHFGHLLSTSQFAEDRGGRERDVKLSAVSVKLSLSGFNTVAVYGILRCKPYPNPSTPCRKERKQSCNEAKQMGGFGGGFFSTCS